MRKRYYCYYHGEDDCGMCAEERRLRWFAAFLALEFVAAFGFVVAKSMGGF